MSSTVGPQSWPEGWPAPNYENPATRGNPSLFLVTSVVTTVVVALRIYSRYRLPRSAGIDDVLLLGGYILSIGQTIAQYKALTIWGWNKHLWDIPPDRLKYVRLAAWLIEFFFLIGTACTKISILLVYRKISSGSHTRWFIRLTWAAIAFTILYTVALWLELMLVCRPLPSYWESSDPTYSKSYRCGNERSPIVLSAAASVFSDVYSSVLPMLLTARLLLTTRQRIGLYVLFSAGLLTAGVGCARLYFLLQVTKNYQPGPNTHDITWEGWPTFALTDMEAHLAIICASAPALKVLFKRHISHQLSNVHASVRSGSFRRTPSRSYQFGNEQIEEPKRHSHAPQGRIESDPLSRIPSNDEQDVESLSLQSYNCDKPLASRAVHIADLQRYDWR